MTWDELADEIAKMTPAERAFSVSVMNFASGQEFLIDEVNFEEQGEHLGDCVRPLFIINS